MTARSKCAFPLHGYYCGKAIKAKCLPLRNSVEIQQPQAVELGTLNIRTKRVGYGGLEQRHVRPDFHQLTIVLLEHQGPSPRIGLCLGSAPQRRQRCGVGTRVRPPTSGPPDPATWKKDEEICRVQPIVNKTEHTELAFAIPVLLRGRAVGEPVELDPDAHFGEVALDLLHEEREPNTPRGQIGGVRETPSDLRDVRFL